MGTGVNVENLVKTCLGVALLLAATTIVAKAFVAVRRQGRNKGVRPEPFSVRPLPTLGIGVLGGLVVDMTSVGSGSLIIVLLLLLYPSLTARELVGTDLVQAIPLVASAALGHLLFGDFKFGLTTSLLIGSIPGVYIGARVSSRAPQGIVRRALAFVLFASGLKLVDLPTAALAVTVSTSQ